MSILLIRKSEISEVELLKSTVYNQFLFSKPVMYDSKIPTQALM